MEQLSSGYPLDSRRMEMLHALLPYIPLTMQKFLNIYIGFEELLKAIRIIQNGAFICSDNTSVKSETPQDLLHVLRGLCTPQENEMIDMIFNMNKMMSMYDNYKDMFNIQQQAAPPTNQPSANPFEMLNQMNQFRNTSEIDDLFQNFMN